ncbi:MAG: hypothetical protein OXG03_07120 [Gammaproteobacteria bacterium]|nr:hypothetical protein [Gammaproteobacteria bacterium]
MLENSHKNLVCLLEKDHGGSELGIVWRKKKTRFAFVAVFVRHRLNSPPCISSCRLFVDEETGQYFLRVVMYPETFTDVEEKVYWRPVSKNVGDMIAKKSRTESSG